MLSRYISRLNFKSVALMASLAVSMSANGNTLLDTNGKPLPDEFGALLQQLSESDAATRKVLGLSTEEVAKVTEKGEKNTKVVVPKQAKKSTNKSSEDGKASKSDKTDSAVEEVVEVAEPKKNPAFYDMDLARRLYNALDVGDAPRVKWMLQSGAGNVYVSEDNDTSLRLAIRKGWASVVRILLERDPDLEHEKGGKTTLLHEASVKGAYDIAKMLVEAGLDPEATTTKNWTNLHLSARHGHVNMIRYYLSLGLEADARNSEGNTAFWLARHAQHYQAAGYLSSRTNASSYEMFNGGKGKKGKKKKNRKKRNAAPEFSAAELQAILGG